MNLKHCIGQKFNVNVIKAAHRRSNFLKTLVGSAQADPTVIPTLRGNHSKQSHPAGPQAPQHCPGVYPVLSYTFFGNNLPLFLCKIGSKRTIRMLSLIKFPRLARFLGTHYIKFGRLIYPHI